MIHFLKIRVYKDKIYIADCRKGFYIAVFDSSGHKLCEIKKDYPKIELDRQFKESIMKKYKTSKLWIENKRNFNYIFPEYFSEIKDFKVSDNRIYVFTYKKKNDNYQLLTMDLNGKVIKEMFVPYKSVLFDIKYSKYFYIHDTGEDWVLSAIEL